MKISLRRRLRVTAQDFLHSLLRIPLLIFKPNFIFKVVYINSIKYFSENRKCFFVSVTKGKSQYEFKF